jgi:hypothetical protein
MYQAIITRLRDVRQHPKADRLKLATAAGCTVIVGLDHKDGDLGLFFPPDGQLSKEYAEANNLIRKKDPETGKNIGGFFEENRRVRNIGLRGIKTEGYWAPVQSVMKTLGHLNTPVPTGSLDALFPEGSQIDSFHEVPLCNKYMTEATLRERKKNSKKEKKKKRRELPGLARHWDTPQLKHHLHSLRPVPATIVITEKLHGTSGRFGYAKVTRELEPQECSWWTRLKSWVTRKPLPETTEWKQLSGTRNVILHTDESGGFYGSHAFRHEAVDILRNKLHKGETVYFELVGYTDSGKPIMSPHGTKKLKDKKFQEKYGDQMIYSYGCTPEKSFPIPGVGISTIRTDLYVYRISRTTEDGHELDMPWSQVKARCAELNVKHVPELFQWRTLENGAWDIWEDAGHMGQCIQDTVDEEIDGPSSIDESHIREGVCVRIEYNDNTQPKIFKAKSWTFGVLEGYLKDNSDYVDLEEIS